MKKAFTLAEVLITLGIIGVVAAMTIPTLVTNNQQRSMNTAANVFTRKLGEALKVMNSQSSLAGHATTEAFVAELSKHFKIVNTCKNDKLANCFASEFTVGDEVVDTTKLKLAKNLNSAGDYGTNVMGVQFASGVSALIAYNPNCSQDPYSNQIVGVSGDKNNIGLSTDSISILYDVTGANNPNMYTTDKDIRGINVALKTSSCQGIEYNNKCIVDLGTSYSALDCSDSAAGTSDYTSYCGQWPSQSTMDYWAGGQKACESIGLSMIEDHNFYREYSSVPGLPTSGVYFSKSENDASGYGGDPNHSNIVLGASAEAESNGFDVVNKTTQAPVMCIGN